MNRVPAAGVGLFPTSPLAEFAESAVVAESAGFDTVWIGDSQNIWREAMVALGVVAARTSTVRVGTGVSNVATRHRAVMASAFASLDELTGGRMILGLGAGDSSLETMGLRPTRLEDLETSVRDIRLLLDGEAATEPDSGSEYRLTYVERPTEVPIFLAASKPRMTALAGRIADGVILAVGVDERLIRTGLGWLDEGLAASGRDRKDVEVVLWVPTCIADDGDWARDQVRAHVARTVKRRPPIELSAEDEAAIENIIEKYDYQVHLDPAAAHSELVTDGLVERFALAGTPDEVRGQIEGLSSGVDQIAIIPTPRSSADRLTTIRGYGDVLADLGVKT